MVSTLGALPGLATDDWVRTDGGSAEQCTGRANAPYPGSGSGQALGTDRTLSVAAGRWRQQGDVVGWVGGGSAEIAYATVTATPAAARVWVCVSLVDSSSGDPTAVAAVRASSR